MHLHDINYIVSLKHGYQPSKMTETVFKYIYEVKTFNFEILKKISVLCQVIYFM